MLANSKSVKSLCCATCDLWMGNRDLKIGKADVLAGPRGTCPVKRCATEYDFQCGHWKMWRKLL